MFTCIDVGPFLLNVSNTLCDNKGLFYAILFYSSVNPFLLHIHYVVWFVFLSKRCAQSANLQSLTKKHNCLSSKKIVSEMQASMCNATFCFTFTTYKTCFSTDWEEEKKISVVALKHILLHIRQVEKIHTQTLSHSHTHVKTYDIFPNGANAILTSSVVISGFKSPTKTWKWSSTKENTDIVNKLFANPQ